MKFNEEEKAQWLKDWRQSGKKAWTYAKENGLCPQTFARWKNLKPEGKSGFVEVPVKTMPVIEYRHEILIEKGEVKIHIPLTINTEELRTIISILGVAA